MADNPFAVSSFWQDYDYGKANQESQDYIGSFSSAIPKIYGQLSSQLGIPQLQETTQRYQETADDLTSSLFALPENVAGRTRESLVTAPQKARMVAAEAQPMQESLAQVGNLGERAGARLATAQTELGRQMEMAMLPFEMGYDNLTKQQAMEFAGYSLEMKSELDRLLSNAQLGYSWTTDEANRANQLAIAEKEYENRLAQLRLEGEQDRLTKRAPSDLGTLFSQFFG